MSRLEGGYEHLATKADVERLRADMTAEIGSVRAELKAEIGSVRADMTAEIGSVRGEIERLRAEIRDSKISTILWLTGIMGALTAAEIGAVVALFRAFSG